MSRIESIATPQAGDLPVLLLDVDGVVLFHGVKPPEGWIPSTDERPAYTFYNPKHGELLRPLQEVTNSYYMTSHGVWAHDNIGNLLGLAEMPYVDYWKFEKDSDHTGQLNNRRRTAIEVYFPGRQIVWIDNEFTPYDYEWADQRTARVAPTLLVHPESEKGLQVEHVEQVHVWLGRLAANQR